MATRTLIESRFANYPAKAQRAVRLAISEIELLTQPGVADPVARRLFTMAAAWVSDAQRDLQRASKCEQHTRHIAETLRDVMCIYRGACAIGRAENEQPLGAKVQHRLATALAALAAPD